MSYLTGKITADGAVIDVLVEASKQRRRFLRKNGIPVPPAVQVRALIDTGASISGFAPPSVSAPGYAVDCQGDGNNIFNACECTARMQFI